MIDKYTPEWSQMQSAIEMPMVNEEDVDGGIYHAGFLLVMSQFNQEFPRDASIPDITREVCHRMPHQSIEELKNCYVHQLYNNPMAMVSDIMYVSGETQRLPDGKVYFMPSDQTLLSYSDYQDIIGQFGEHDEVKEALSGMENRVHDFWVRRNREKDEKRHADRKARTEAWIRAHPVRYRIGWVKIGWVPEEIGEW